MPPAPVHRYRAYDEDSARWGRLTIRAGDIVISTRSKSGTTWMQMICALLVFGRPELPAPLAQLSPWLDWPAVPLEEVLAQLDAQPHRRFIKTHTPLDGIPIDPRASYIVVARHPLDAAVSLYHHATNIDRVQFRRLAGLPEPIEQAPAGGPQPLRQWLLDWVDQQVDDPREQLDSLQGVMWHLSDAWARRSAPNVVLVRYEDLSADLPGQMHGLASALGISIREEEWPALIEAASFERMGAEAERLVPDPSGVVIKDPAAFFRRGRPGAGRELLTRTELDRYNARAAELAPAELLAWLHAP
jgi:aryl sulfotransferase